MAETVLIPRIAVLYELQSSYLEPKLKKLGISLNTFHLLMAIQNSGEKVSQIEIARRLGISPATLSETVSLHIGKGLLEQVVSKKDRRVKFLRLTKSANSKVKDIRKLLSNLEKLMLEGISGSNVRTAATILDAAIENIEKTL
ncbi:MAG: MarR family transcriptional regulator [Chthonomonas sp.]|nr:MarR family transcriptional regulator [Chthonomonas sp.]